MQGQASPKREDARDVTAKEPRKECDRRKECEKEVVCMAVVGGVWWCWYDTP